MGRGQQTKMTEGVAHGSKTSLLPNTALTEETCSGPSSLLLTGFGVGSVHEQRRQLSYWPDSRSNMGCMVAQDVAYHCLPFPYSAAQVATPPWLMSQNEAEPQVEQMREKHSSGSLEIVVTEPPS